mmetsp:Transcript_31935/g.68965  ORF Transcript_31935/g.68965 Transcript_31935/m.68965 type:complete len:437 (-) Transcript_31935:126-1436(-)
MHRCISLSLVPFHFLRSRKLSNTNTHQYEKKYINSAIEDMITCSLRKLNRGSISSSISTLRRHFVRPNSSGSFVIERGTTSFQSRSFSFTFNNNNNDDNDNDDYDADDSNDNDTATTSTSNLLFPWRHAPTLPDRVLAHNDYSGQFNPTTRDPYILRKLIAARELNVSAWNVLPIPFYRHEWECDLANGFAVGFGFAVEELWRSLFRVPVKNENGIISIDSSTQTTSITDHISSSSSSSSPNKDDNNEYLLGMMDKKLLREYQTLVNPTDVHFKFSLEPIASRLQHLFAVPVPGLTREIVEDNPYVRGSIYRLHSSYEENGFDERYFDMLTDFAKYNNDARDKRTVIAEAAITCLEFFQVRDRASGRLVMGMEDDDDDGERGRGEEVVHIVRFEVVTEEKSWDNDNGDDDDGNERREIGNWKITDVDDLLEGNLFH